eukprot:1963822-Prymnesium_polylepis.1
MVVGHKQEQERHGSTTAAHDRTAHNAMRLRSWRCLVLTPLSGVKFCSDETCLYEIGNRAKGSEGSTLQIGKGGKSSRATAT